MIRNPYSLWIQSRRGAKSTTFVSGIREKTSYGPVKSNCVMDPNNNIPTVSAIVAP
jgi:hypothetical protein